VTRRRLVGFSLLAVFTLLWTLLWALLGTQRGLEFAFAQLQRLAPGTLEVGELRGRIVGPIGIEGLRYEDDGLTLRVAQAELDWSPQGLLRGLVDIEVLRAQGLVWVSAGGSESEADLDPAGLPALPVALALRDARLRDARIEWPGRAPLRIDALGLSGSLRGERLQLEGLELQAPQGEFAASGRLRLTEPYAHELRLRWRYDAEALPAPLAGEGSLSGDQGGLRLVQRLQGPLAGELTGEIVNPLTEPRFDARLRIAGLDTAGFVPALPVGLSGDLTLTGALEDLALGADLRLAHAQAGDWTLQAAGHWTAGTLELESAVLAQPEGPARAEASGRWSPGPEGGRLAGTLRWTQLAWPSLGRPDAGEAVAVRSPEGRLELDGALQGYRLELAAELQAPDLPALRVRASGTGDRVGLTLPSLRLEALSGRAEGRARLAWSPELGLEARLRAEGIDPSGWRADWPGALDAGLELRLTPGPAGLRARLDVSELRGRLRGYLVEGGGRLSNAGDGLEIDGLRLRVGGSRIEVDGGLAQTLDLEWSLASPDLQALWPGAAGSLQARGHITGDRAAPALAAEIDGGQIAWGRWRVGRFAGRVRAALDPGAPLALALRATDLAEGARRWDRLQVSVDGTPAAHRAGITLEGERGRLQAQATGALSQPLSWAGSLERLDAELPGLGRWGLRAPGELRLAPDQALLGSVCLAREAAALCGEADWREGVGVGGLRLRGVPASLVEPWLPGGLRLGGTVEGALAWRIPRSGAPVADLDLALAEGRLEWPRLDAPVAFAPSRLGAVLDGEGLRASLALPLADGGGLQASLSLPGWRPGVGEVGAQGLGGRVEVERLPLALLDGFVDPLVVRAGTLELAAELGGTLERPRIDGRSRLREAALELPALGLALSEVSAELASPDGRRAQYRLAMRSGEGLLELRGETLFDPAAGWPSRATLSGADVTVLDVPEALVVASPRLELASRGRRIDVTGEVELPRARLRPRRLPEGAVTPSGDVVLVGDGREAASQERWQVHSSVRVRLGERVDFDGFGVSGRLAGEVLLTDEPGRLTTGQGELRIENGVYRLRGQDLEIRRGRLLYAQTPIDDPGVDVEAVRRIEDVLAGVRLRGSLREPRIAIFSEPAMNETDALSYLLLGRPLSQADADESNRLQGAAAAVGVLGGDLLARQVGERLGVDEVRVEAGETVQQTALVVGKYLSPRLYVRYITGVVESSNIVQLRYEIGRRIEIQTEGGYRGSEAVSGGDLFFTIER
jgi:translocation and assembly module TamB